MRSSVRSRLAPPCFQALQGRGCQPEFVFGRCLCRNPSFTPELGPPVPACPKAIDAAQREKCVVTCVATARSLPVSGVLASCRSGAGEGGTADNPREHCPSVLFGLLRCHCILDGVEISRRGLSAVSSPNFLGYLLDWEERSLQVLFSREIPCATLLRWDVTHVKFLYPNRIRAVVWMEECSGLVGSPLWSLALCRVGVL